MTRDPNLTILNNIGTPIEDSKPISAYNLLFKFFPIARPDPDGQLGCSLSLQEVPATVLITLTIGDNVADPLKYDLNESFHLESELKVDRPEIPSPFSI